MLLNRWLNISYAYVQLFHERIVDSRFQTSETGCSHFVQIVYWCNKCEVTRGWTKLSAPPSICMFFSSIICLISNFMFSFDQ